MNSSAQINNMAPSMTTLEQPLPAATRSRSISIGFPSGAHFGERRFPLTPEAANLLCNSGYTIKIEQGAGEPIHYSDAAYLRAGADVATRREVLMADIIISPAPLHPGEARRLRRGAMLLTLLKAVTAGADYARALLHAGVNVIAADLISIDGHRLIADILHEIDGCASLAIASSLLSDPIHGKGILLGGVTGVVPCEVMVLGSGMGAIAAAHNALGFGATVRMFDNDLYSLRSASRVLNHRAIASALHTKVVESALRSADVVIVTPMTHSPVFTTETVVTMKRRTMIFDLTTNPGATFPGLGVTNLADPQVNVLTASDGRAVYCNVGCRVARTAAMALSNALVANIDGITAIAGSLANVPEALRPAMLMFWGKCVNRRCEEILGVRAIDINLLSGN